MSYVRATSPVLYFEDDQGHPLAGGWLYTFIAGTDTPVETYVYRGTQYESQGVCVRLNSRGECEVCLDPSLRYKFVLWNADRTEKLWEKDDVMAPGVVTMPDSKDVVVEGDGTLTFVAKTESGGVVKYKVTVSSSFVQQVEDNTQAIADETERAQEAEAAATTEVVAGDNIQVTETTARDGHKVYTVNGVESVPNVEITSPNGTLNISESTDQQTNTKTFEIDVKGGTASYGFFTKNSEAWRTSYQISGVTARKIEGSDISLSNGYIYLKKGLYHVDCCVELAVPGLTNQYYQAQIYCLSGTTASSIKQVDDTFAHAENLNLSFDVEITTDNTELQIFIRGLPSGSYVWLYGMSVHKVVTAGAGGSGGSSYTAGDAIGIVNGEISVKHGDGLSVNEDNELEVKLGDGLAFEEQGGIKVISVDSDVSDVVETVQKLAEDLDKKINTTYPFAQITSMSDYANFGVSGTDRMCGQLFAVPITSEIRKDETMICVNALQGFSGDVVFGIFEYDFEANNGTGSTYWIADTGTVRVQAGENEFPIRHILESVSRPKIELLSSRLYYAAILVRSTSPATGLMLASCPAYGATYNAKPLYTMVVSNMDQYVDWSDGDISGTWFQGYNEVNGIPRLFMMIRNGDSTPVVVTEPFTDIGNFTLQHTNRIGDLSSVTPLETAVLYQKIIPAQDVDVKRISYVDYRGSITQNTVPLILMNDFDASPLATTNDATCIVGDSDNTKVDGTHYIHTYEFTTAVHLTANTIYWVPVNLNFASTTNQWVIQYASPSVTRDLQFFNSFYNISSWANSNGNGQFLQGQTAPFCRIMDNNNNEWTF